MISSAQVQILSSIVDSEAFETIILEMKKDIFDEWIDSNNLEDRERLYAELMGLERVIETLRAKIDKFLSGDTV